MKNSGLIFGAIIVATVIIVVGVLAMTFQDSQERRVLEYMIPKKQKLCDEMKEYWESSDPDPLHIGPGFQVINCFDELNELKKEFQEKFGLIP